MDQNESDNRASVHRVVHTPGPWRVSKTGRSVLTSSVKINQSSGPMAASCEVAERHNRMLEANARLIAAAPELLEACLDAISKIEDCDDGKINFRRDFADRLKEAVAKAV